jgi:hypothetical protein
MPAGSSKLVGVGVRSVMVGGRVALLPFPCRVLLSFLPQKAFISLHRELELKASGQAIPLAFGKFNSFRNVLFSLGLPYLGS